MSTVAETRGLRRLHLNVRLLPRTMLWRTFLLITLLMSVSVVSWFRIYSYYEREPRAEQIAQMVVSIVNLTRAALISADVASRRGLLLEVSDREGIRVYPSEVGEAMDPLPDTPIMRLMQKKVRGQLGERTQFADAVDGDRGFWVSFQMEDDDYWIVLPRDRFERKFPAEWLGWGILTGLLSMAGAYLIVFRVTRPLKALSGAARSVGRGETPEPLDESGPAELATVARAFNRMSRNLAQLDSDRALILAGVSHDLRTPLARLRLGIEMSGADTAAREGMEIDIDEMDRIIGQFLEFARQDEQLRGGETLTQIELPELLLEVAEQYSKRGTAITVRQPKSLKRLPARPLALRRVLSNLIDNAVRYAGTDTPIEVELSQTRDEIVISVLDRGPGIPPDQVERLKRPFTRLQTARTDARGSGLGLAIVDRIVRAHGGELRLEPREGGGLAARILLPFVSNSIST